jgi:tol-pal system protein YbgF
MKPAGLFTRGCLSAVAAAAVVVGLQAGSAFAQQRSEVQPLLDRIDRLEKDMRLLHQEWARGAAPTGARPPASGGTAAAPSGPPPAPGSLANFDSRLGAVEDDLRQATGRDEEISNKLDRMSERLDKLVSDIDMRLTTLERGGAVGAGPQNQANAGPDANAMPAPPPSGAPGTLGTLRSGGGASAGQQSASNTPATQKLSPEQQYEQARRYLGQGKMAEAEQSLKVFMDSYPQHELASNAQYWLGETYYVRENYAAAAQAFVQGYQKYKTGSKAPDSLLKLGMSLIALKKNPEACATFKQLETDFPKAPDNIKSVAAQQKKAANCR